MTQKLLHRPAGRASRLLVSAALVIVSGGYAYWQDRLPHDAMRHRPHYVTFKAASTPQPFAAQTPAPRIVPTAPLPVPAAVATAQAPLSPPVHKKASAVSLAAPPAPAPAETAPPPSAATQSVASPSPAASLGNPAPAAPHRLYAFNDGDYTGEPSECEFGTVQVKVSVHDGAITNVQFLQMPDHRERSAEISDWAAPMLASETIKEQNYDIDIVSSATFTTIAFQQSLGSALQQARKS